MSTEKNNAANNGDELPAHGTADKKNSASVAAKTPASPQLVERKTGLRGISIDPRRKNKSSVRKETEAELLEKNPEVPYHAMEHAIRDLVCSLLERQDRMIEEIYGKIIDLQYRVDDLEMSRRDSGKKTSTGTPGAAR